MANFVLPETGFIPVDATASTAGNFQFFATVAAYGTEDTELSLSGSNLMTLGSGEQYYALLNGDDGNELVLVTACDGDTATVERNVLGSVALSTINPGSLSMVLALQQLSLADPTTFR